MASPTFTIFRHLRSLFRWFSAALLSQDQPLVKHFGIGALCAQCNRIHSLSLSLPCHLIQHQHPNRNPRTKQDEQTRNEEENIRRSKLYVLYTIQNVMHPNTKCFLWMKKKIVFCHEMAKKNNARKMAHHRNHRKCESKTMFIKTACILEDSTSHSTSLFCGMCNVFLSLGSRIYKSFFDYRFNGSILDLFIFFANFSQTHRKN